MGTLDRLLRTFATDQILTFSISGKLQLSQAGAGWSEQHTEPGGRQVQHSLQRDRAHGRLEDDQGDHP